MKKITLGILSLILSATAAFSFVGCENDPFMGLSAYEVAVQEGFKGTEAEWLASLHGTPGKDGSDLDAKELYESAKAEGYTGTYLEFLKEYLKVDLAEDNDTAQIAENMLSVVSINAYHRKSLMPGDTTGSAGSGVIVGLDKENGNAIIVTNFHVVYNAEAFTPSTGISDMIYVYPYGSRAANKNGLNDGIKARYVGGSINYDIAVLEVSGSEYIKKANLTAVDLDECSSESVIIGEKTFVIGNPQGYGISVTEGILSVDSEYIDVEMIIKQSGVLIKQPIYYRVMRTDAPINGGNSGGGLFNTAGKLVGIINAKTVSDGVDNMGYALPITQVKYVVQNILDNKTGHVERAMLGVTIGTKSSMGKIDDSGNVYVDEEIMVETVTEGSKAMGKILPGDIIKSLTINGETKAVTRRFILIDFMLTLRKGDSMTVEFERNGERKTETFTFDEDGDFTTY